MKSTSASRATASALGCLMLAHCLAGSARDASPAASGEWRVIGLTSDNKHYSPLSQINDRNVAEVSLAWWADMPTRDGLVGEPLVADGVIYQSGVPSMVWANDVRTGKLLWAFDAKVKFSGDFVPSWGSRTNRGLALWKNKVYVGTGDCRLVAIERNTGKEAWQANVCADSKGMTITSAPRVGGGKVFIGNANADTAGTRGFVDAYDADSGRRIWRFYTIPGDPSKGFESKALERAAKTWGKHYWTFIGNGTANEGMTYDEKLNLLYFGTDSASPEAPIDRGADRGDELFTASVVAVNADTGEYVWHYKETPNNAWNFDSTCPITIADLNIGGRPRRVLLHAPKNGFIYVLDASTGKFISADEYGPRVTWASGVDQKTGRPIERPEARYYEMKDGVALHYPGQIGARGLLPAAFSPLTGLTYLPTIDAAGRTTYSKPANGGSGSGPEAGGTGVRLSLNTPEIVAAARTQLVAWDPVHRKARWALEEKLPYFGGPLVTAGNVLFVAKGSLLRALNAQTGEVLWSRIIPGGSIAPPVTVEVDGEQLVLFAIGNNGASAMSTSIGAPYINDGLVRAAPSRLLAFKLRGHAVLPDTNLNDTYPKPPLPRFPQELADRGHRAVAQNGCDYCHGGEHLDAVGSVPNLKKLDAATHAVLGRIVIGGFFKSRGMPDFSYLDEDTVKAIQAYIINQAWNSYDAQNQKNE